MTFIDPNRNEWLLHSLYIGVLLLIAAICGLSLWDGRRLFIYPAFTAFLATLVSAFFLPGMDHNFAKTPRLSILSGNSEIVENRVFVILLYLMIFLLQLIYTFAGFSDAYYILLIVFVVVFAILVIRGQWLFPLVGLLLLAVLFRGHIWFSAPIYSKDPQLHTAIVGYMIEQNELVPPSISYYWAYPIADIFAKEVALVLSTTAKRAYFYAITIPAVLAALVVFPAVRQVLNYQDDSMAVASIALVLFSAFHLVESSGPKPQTLSTFYLAVILLLLVSEFRHRRTLAALFFFILVKTHLLAPLIATGLVGTYFLIVYTYPKLVSGSAFVFQENQPYFITLALIAATFQQYHFVGHFRIQVLRFLSTFQPSQGGAEAFISQAGELTTTDVPITLDPLLLQAGTLLIIGFLVTVTSILFFANLLSVRQDQVEWTWVLTGIVLFVFFSAGFFGSAVIRRGAAAVSVLTAPLVAFALLTFVRKRGAGTTVIFITLLLSGTYLGVAHPGVLLSERDNGFRPTLSSSEIESMDFVRDMNGRPFSFSYYTASAFRQTVQEGQPNSFISGFQHHNRVKSNSLHYFCNEYSNEAFVYRRYYAEYADTKLPSNVDIVYSTGDIQIIPDCNTKSGK